MTDEPIEIDFNSDSLYRVVLYNPSFDDIEVIVSTNNEAKIKPYFNRLFFRVVSCKVIRGYIDNTDKPINID